MELLLSDIPPLRLGNRSFSDCFASLVRNADYMRIASGYISTESLTEIKRIIESNNGPSLDLIIGMHYFEGITRPQYEAASYLNEFLISSDMGKVSVVTTFKLHGKMYSFEKEGEVFAGIMGSSNISSMIDSHRNYETDILLTEKSIIYEINSFLKKTSNITSKPISDWLPDSFIENNRLLKGHESVRKIDNIELLKINNDLNGVVFDISLKATKRHQKSNLNVYFGKGRENKSTGFIKPRHWYEVEIIVPKSITDKRDYPKAGFPDKESIIDVYTDDGWKFQCKISGDYSKNFRSNDDLKILGKWIKGRLENAGVLHIGEIVTEEILKKYGRDSFQLKGTNRHNVWFLDFGI
ncbi:hypothetical protein BJAS_P4290 [Bathymodiolus japonicus methanotrophic gill symbiont]|uniref:restriction endonuclease PLD domain-containing protein n=1 Tax=Bathymodiolus japonicus methanotrophic gill symbiont TaxID=113269 RepID=UPI001B5B36E8|nr:restriction endonuclease PLD domain-containing protein [Bathymodiolus japonicus methanotrophic gill symbiont]GFO73471.1 hypothetical protein BJAS_P4290 [Bathymodiolus japonicus methanotrophic gill symbiont]